MPMAGALSLTRSGFCTNNPLTGLSGPLIVTRDTLCLRHGRTPLKSLG